MGFLMYLVNKHVLIYYKEKYAKRLEENTNQTELMWMMENLQPSSADKHEDAATLMQRQDNVRKEEAAIILGEMGGDTSGVISRVKEEKLSLQGKGILYSKTFK